MRRKTILDNDKTSDKTGKSKGLKGRKSSNKVTEGGGRRGARRNNRDGDDDAKSQKTTKTAKSLAKSLRSKSRKSGALGRKSKQEKSQGASSNKRINNKLDKVVTEDAVNVERGENEDNLSKQQHSADEKLKKMNDNLEKSVNESFLDGSSFDASLSDDDSEEDEDDFVTAQEFYDFQKAS